MGTGHRVLLYLITTPQGPATFILTRDNVMLYVDVHFIMHSNQYHHETLLDGEITRRTAGGELGDGGVIIAYKAPV
jgi:hypothetical protein